MRGTWWSLLISILFAERFVFKCDVTDLVCRWGILGYLRGIDGSHMQTTVGGTGQRDAVGGLIWIIGLSPSTSRVFFPLVDVHLWHRSKPLRQINAQAD